MASLNTPTCDRCAKPFPGSISVSYNVNFKLRKVNEKIDEKMNMQIAGAKVELLFCDCFVFNTFFFVKDQF